MFHVEQELRLGNLIERLKNVFIKSVPRGTDLYGLRRNLGFLDCVLEFEYLNFAR